MKKLDYFYLVLKVLNTLSLFLIAIFLIKLVTEVTGVGSILGNLLNQLGNH